MNHKSFKFDLKSSTKAGQFSGRASVYGNVDAHGDVVMPGAFSRTLEELGGEIVVLNQHDSTDPIGKAQLFHRADGLHFQGQLELELPSARDAYVRLKAGLIDGISIGYGVPEGGERFRNGVRELHEIKLWEISLVTFPANTAARVTDVKALGASHDPTFDRLIVNIRETVLCVKLQRHLSEVRTATLNLIRSIR